MSTSLRRPATTRDTTPILTNPDVTGTTGWAAFAGRVATDPVRCVDVGAEPEALATGTWFVVADFEGRARAWQFGTVAPAPDHVPDDDARRTGPDGHQASSDTWTGPDARTWTSSMDRPAYEAAVRRIREYVREGDVYQANLCRVLSAPLPARPGAAGPGEPDARALAARLAAGNPAPHAAAIHIPTGTPGADGGELAPVWVVSASPELYLSLEPGGGPQGRSTVSSFHARPGSRGASGPDGPGDVGPDDRPPAAAPSSAHRELVLTSGPIKGTARTPDGLTDKDRAENVMITDLVRNDLQHVCLPGTVEVSELLAVEHHPGLVHLVSRVRGIVADDVAAAPDLWRHLLAATFPPGSVSGAPKSSALRIISELEPVPRGPYCGAIGWVDGDAGTASLAVGIRTFWWERGDDDAGVLRFGTGAGITWGSDPEAEWQETELKAERLVGLASS